MNDAGLAYVPGLIAAFRAGHATDHVHLGYWPDGAAHNWAEAQAAMTALHLDALDLRDGMLLVDVGCGIGGSLRMAGARVHDAMLVGINIDPRQLAVCRDLHAAQGNRFDWIKADACALPLESGSADRVLSLEAMFHFRDRQAFLAEAARVLRPGGMLVCSDILLGHCDTADSQAWRDLVLRGYAPWPDPAARAPDHARLGAAAGLEPVRAMDISAGVAPTWDHIVPAHHAPLASPVAAMKALHLGGHLTYQVSVFAKA